MISIKRTNYQDSDFKNLVTELDKYLAIQDGEDHEFYQQFNNIDVLDHVVLIYQDQKVVACGAMKPFDSNSMEIKRMFTVPDQRRKGWATKILTELEKWAKELSITSCVLETGKRQPEAIALYHHHGYQVINNFGQYKNMDNSICFKKELI